MSPVLGVESVPVKVVRIEDMDECAEGQSIVPASGEVGHGDWVIFQPILNPHQDHLLCTRAGPGKRGKLEHARQESQNRVSDLAAVAGVARFVGRGDAGREEFL